MQIGHYLAKIWTKVCGLVFLAHPVCIIGRVHNDTSRSSEFVDFGTKRVLDILVVFNSNLSPLYPVASSSSLSLLKTVKTQLATIKEIISKYIES